MEERLIIRDDLNHPAFSWPQSAITLPVSAGFPLEDAVLLGSHGEAVPFQLSNPRETEGRQSAELTLVTDVPTGACKTFTLRPSAAGDPLPQQGIARQTEEALVLPFKEGEVHIAREACGAPLLRFFMGGGICGEAFLHTRHHIAEYAATLTENGAIYAECVLDIRLENGARMIWRLHAVNSLPFVDITEEIQGDWGEDAWIDIVWRGFAPQWRYLRYRQREAIDAYINDDGTLPYILKPYFSWVSWWACKSTSFSDQASGRNIGIFVRKADEWDDGQYALWESNDAPAIRFHWDAAADSLIWRYPLVKGTRATAITAYDAVCEQSFDTSPVDQMWYWHEYLGFDKVKEWILDWDEDQGAYPRFFSPGSIPPQGYSLWHYGMHHQPVSPAFMDEMVYTLSHQMNQLWRAGAVSAREMQAWVYSFDMAAPQMTPEQFARVRACLAFMAYAHLDGNFMPTRHVLAGHPNFLADAVSVSAGFAALLPNHPHARRWVAAFERAMALNLKYHTRPAVALWGAKGGRWTENPGAYLGASLHPMVRMQMLTKHAFGENVLLYPRVVEWAEYMLDMLSAPVDSMRNLPPQGAHSGQIWDPVLPSFYLRQLAESMRHYAPLLAQHLMYVCHPDMREQEERVPGSDVYRTLADREAMQDKGTRPPLQSVKYTGYGYVLRASVHDENEVSVHLQQIDEGPNYRWGRAAQGGCGTIYYYAAGKRYSFNRPEDIGDANMGDAQAGCNFGVLIGHEYKSVGRNELTRPLTDFGFARHARVDAGPYSRPFYRYRSVIMSGGDYIVVHDAVGDMRVHGRFAWFAKADERLPAIVQLKPGAKPIPSDGGHPIDEPGAFRGGNVKVNGVYYDGSGDFLTVVSHRSFNCDYNSYAYATEYGARVELSGRTDYILSAGARTVWQEGALGFDGTAGIIRVYGAARAEAAIFEGSRVSALGVTLSLNGPGRASFVVEQDRISGQVACDVPIEMVLRFDTPPSTLYINGVPASSGMQGNEAILSVPAGGLTWEMTNASPTPSAVTITRVETSSEQAALWYRGDAQRYQIQTSLDCGATWQDKVIAETEHCIVRGLENGSKAHLRIRGSNGDRPGPWSCDYPVYPAQGAPEAPDGLRVWMRDNAVRIIWGQVLGVQGYRLYRRMPEEESFSLVYEGPETDYTDPAALREAEYHATAYNRHGESVPSNTRDGDFYGLGQWDPCPEESFRRYTRSHEFGYRGFDHWENAKRPVLPPYPG